MKNNYDDGLKIEMTCSMCNEMVDETSHFCVHCERWQCIDCFCVYSVETCPNNHCDANDKVHTLAHCNDQCAREHCGFDNRIELGPIVDCYTAIKKDIVISSLKSSPSYLMKKQDKARKYLMQYKN